MLPHLTISTYTTHTLPHIHIIQFTITMPLPIVMTVERRHILSFGGKATHRLAKRVAMSPNNAINTMGNCPSNTPNATSTPRRVKRQTITSPPVSNLMRELMPGSTPDNDSNSGTTGFTFGAIGDRPTQCQQLAEINPQSAPRSRFLTNGIIICDTKPARNRRTAEGRSQILVTRTGSKPVGKEGKKSATKAGTQEAGITAPQDEQIDSDADDIPVTYCPAQRAERCSIHRPARKPWQVPGT